MFMYMLEYICIISTYEYKRVCIYKYFFTSLYIIDKLPLTKYVYIINVYIIILTDDIYNNYSEANTNSTNSIIVLSVVIIV